MFDEASPTPPKEGLPVIAEGVEEGYLFISTLIFFYFSEARVTPPWADAEGASVATTAGLSAPRSLACEPLAGGEAALTLPPVPGKR